MTPYGLVKYPENVKNRQQTIKEGPSHADKLICVPRIRNYRICSSSSSMDFQLVYPKKLFIFTDILAIFQVQSNIICHRAPPNLSMTHLFLFFHELISPCKTTFSEKLFQISQFKIQIEVNWVS